MGTRIYLFGSNPTATFYSGVNNKAVLMRVYLISGLLAGVAAMIMIARFNSAKADYGESYLLLTVLASVLGGVSAAGGFGRVSGLVVALVILQIISSGLNLFGVSAFLTVALWGIVLIFVMVIKYLLEQRTLRSASQMKTLLGIDLGTTSLKAALFSAAGRAIGSEGCEYPILSPQPGYAEQDPLEWREALEAPAGA